MNFGGTVKLNPVGVFVLFGLSFILLVYILAGRRSVEKEISLKELLKVAVNVAKKGGDTINKFRDANLNERSKGKTKEGAPDLVTDADYGSHCIMYFNLLSSFPSLKVISEEKHSLSECHLPDRLEPLHEVLSVTEDEGIIKLDDVTVPLKDVTVWIDPLDATKEFTEKLYEFVTTMVCVAVHGKPIIGVIHQPFDEHSTTSWVWVEKGESPNLVIKNHELASEYPVIIVSRSHAGNVSQVVEKSMPQAKVINAGGSGYKVLQLIKGHASAYIHTTAIKKWDICAGNAFLNRFGGRMSTLDNEDIDYSETGTQIVQEGILATVTNHEMFYQKLKQLKTN